MGRKKAEDGAAPTERENGVEVLQNASDVTTQPSDGQPARATIPTAEKAEQPGDKPFAKFGPYPTGARRTFLSVAVWKKEIVVDGGEVVLVYDASLQRTSYDSQNNPRNSSSLRSGEIQLAILLLEKADRFIRELREHSKVPNGD